MRYTNLQPPQVLELLANDDIEVLDMRDRYSFDMGHLKGAKSANDDVIGRVLREQQHDRPILIYCYQGNSSLSMAEFLIGAGFRQVFNLHGGWAAWHKFMQMP